jgi:transposase
VGRQRKQERDEREVLNGVLWVLRTGAPWYELTQYKPCREASKRPGQRHLLAAVDRLA